MSSSNDNLSYSMTIKPPVYSYAIHALGNDARLRSINIFKKPIKYFTCGCQFHVNKDCMKYNNLKSKRL